MSDWTRNGWYRHRIGSIGGDPKLGKLVRLYGAKGYAVYFLSLEYIYDGCLGDLEIETMADQLKMNKEEVISILETASDSCEGLLVSNTDGTWSSSKAISLKEKDEARRDAKRKKVQEYRDSKRDGVTTTYRNVPEHSDTFQNVPNVSFEKEEVRNKNIRLKEGENIRDKNSSQECETVQGNLPPSPFKKDDVQKLTQDLGRKFDVERFMNYYAIRNWTVDGVPFTSKSQLLAAIQRWPDDKPKAQEGRVSEDHPEDAERIASSMRTL